MGSLKGFEAAEEMESRQAEEETAAAAAADEVGLVVKSPAQRHSDLLLSARRSWSVRRLKAELRHLHPDEPVSSETRMRTRPACFTSALPSPCAKWSLLGWAQSIPLGFAGWGWRAKICGPLGGFLGKGPDVEGWPSWLGLGRKRVSKAA